MKEALVKKNALYEQRLELLEEEAKSHERLASEEMRHATNTQASSAAFEKSLLEEREKLLRASKEGMKERVMKELQDDKLRKQAQILAKIEAEQAIRDEMRKFKEPDWMDLMVGVD
jgi:hypothetical protein